MTGEASPCNYPSRWFPREEFVEIEEVALGRGDENPRGKAVVISVRNVELRKARIGRQP